MAARIDSCSCADRNAMTSSGRSPQRRQTSLTLKKSPRRKFHIVSKEGNAAAAIKGDRTRAPKKATVATLLAFAFMNPGPNFLRW